MNRLVIAPSAALFLLLGCVGASTAFDAGSPDANSADTGPAPPSCPDLHLEWARTVESEAAGSRACLEDGECSPISWDLTCENLRSSGCDIGVATADRAQVESRISTAHDALCERVGSGGCTSTCETFGEPESFCDEGRCAVRWR